MEAAGPVHCHACWEKVSQQREHWQGMCRQLCTCIPRHEVICERLGPHNILRALGFETAGLGFSWLSRAAQAGEAVERDAAVDGARSRAERASDAPLRNGHAPAR